ncbi:MAG: helix-turn-helix transcriptional regulator [Phycisphaerae bacterium]|nr:helix-turn-helix transcriptional regulator [Phycisphaerae bacterium]NUQ44740.1 helix-turn-helix transcriptional regulator [Phycisphaerae bacterium]
MDIVQQILKLARARGISIYRLAKDADLGVAAVQRMVKGGGAKVSTAEKLARVVGCRLVLQPTKRKQKAVQS